MKNKLNIDLVFLYQLPLVRNYGFTDNDPEYDDWVSKYREEYYTFLDFIEQAKMSDIIYLYMYAFRENTPDVGTLVYALADTSEEISETKMKFVVSRPDIIGFQRKIVLGDNIDELLPEGRDRFDKELTIFLGESYTMSVIDDALQGIVYEKETDGDMTTYKVQDGVIDTLVATPNKIVITISDDRLVDYYRTSPRNPD